MSKNPESLLKRAVLTSMRKGNQLPLHVSHKLSTAGTITAKSVGELL